MSESDKSQDIIEITGVVKEVLPDFTFRVLLENGILILAKGAGKLRKKRVRISVLDNVIVEITKYDPNRGRISKRL